MTREEIIAANPLPEYLCGRGFALVLAGPNFVTSACPITQLEAQRMYTVAKGNLPHFDFEHPASFLVSEFFWRATPPLAGCMFAAFLPAQAVTSLKPKHTGRFPPALWSSNAVPRLIESFSR